MAIDESVDHANAGRIIASTFGVLAGVGGLIHGIGEIRQGNIPAGGFMIDSWAEGRIAVHMDGDPALTVIPNLLATGIAASVVSLIVIAWAVLCVQRRNGGRILMLLSVLLLLVGGGVGAPVMGILAGWAGTTIHAPLTWWRRRLPESLQQLLARLWPWVFAVAAISGLMLVAGALVLIYSFGIGNSDFYFGLFLVTVVTLVASIITGIAHDLRHRELPAAI